MVRSTVRMVTLKQRSYAASAALAAASLRCFVRSTVRMARRARTRRWVTAPRMGRWLSRVHTTLPSHVLHAYARLGAIWLQIERHLGGSASRPASHASWAEKMRHVCQ